MRKSKSKTSFMSAMYGYRVMLLIAYPLLSWDGETHFTKKIRKKPN